MLSSLPPPILHHPRLFIESNPDLASRASLRWAVTGTPISASFSDIRPVSNWLGHWGADSPTSLKMSALTQACTGSLGYLPVETKQQRLADLADALKHLMIRHTKSMQIGGEDALALPTLESETKFLDMAPYEKKIYRAVHLIARKLPQVQKSRKEGCDGFRLSMQLATMYQACTGAYSNGIATYDLTTASKIFTNDVAKTVKGKLQYAIGTPASIMPKFGSKVSLAEVRQAEEERTKLKALESDLKDLQKVEPAFHAVVFTHLSDVLERVGAMARNLGVEVYEVKTALSMKQRHQQIQVSDKSPNLPPFFLWFFFVFLFFGRGLLWCASSRILMGCTVLLIRSTGVGTKHQCSFSRAPSGSTVRLYPSYADVRLQFLLTSSTFLRPFK